MAPKPKKELTPEAIENMKVVELRNELKRMGLKTTGSKDKLVALLKVATNKNKSDSQKQHIEENMSKKSNVQQFFQLSREIGCSTIKELESGKIKEICGLAKEIMNRSEPTRKLVNDRIRLELYKRKKQIEAFR